MGKQRRQRSKYHSSVGTRPHDKNLQHQKDNASFSSTPLMFDPSDSLFKGLNIDFNNLNKLPGDDTKSVKSFKSAKSELSQDKALSKKEKLQLRKGLLLRKIDSLAQLKKDGLKRRKRKNNAIIGDTNPLHDALPSLESLLKDKPVQINTKPKAIQKASKRKKTTIEGVKVFKKLLSEEKIKNNTFKAISDHINSFVAKH